MSWTLQQLAKSQDDTMVVGICGGLGQHTPVPAWLWRAGMVVTAFAGAGVVVYGALWLFMPDAPEGQDDRGAAKQFAPPQPPPFHQQHGRKRVPCCWERTRVV